MAISSILTTDTFATWRTRINAIITDLNLKPVPVAVAKGDLIISNASPAYAVVSVGTNEQILRADSTDPEGVVWSDDRTPDSVAKGDLIGATGAAGTFAIVTVGANDFVLTADSAAGPGFSWKVIPEQTPTGLIAPYAAAAAPSGWLLCDGAAVSRTTFADLFALIASTYGDGNGTTTFNVPDMRGRVALALDNLGGASANRVTNAAADSLGGSEGSENQTLPNHLHSGSANHSSHTHTGSANHTSHTHSIPNHTHSFSATTSAPSQTANGGQLVAQNSSSNSHTHTVSGTTGATGGTSGAPSATLTHGITGSESATLTHGDTGNPTTSPSIDTMQPYLSLSYIVKT